MTPSEAETVRNLPKSVVADRATTGVPRFRDPSPAADARRAALLERAVANAPGEAVLAALPFDVAAQEALDGALQTLGQDRDELVCRAARNLDGLRRTPPVFWDGVRFVAWIDPR